MARSGVGAEVELDRLPRSAVLAAQPEPLQRECLLAGGDDYELLFAAPPQAAAGVEAAGRAAGVPVQRIGRLVAAPGLRVLGRDGRTIDLAGHRAFDHFRV
jgi:thiamine-monophosphate kinase